MESSNAENKGKNVIKNSLVGFFGQLVFLIFSFVSRTFFIKLLGSSYLGINGLFTNILSLLSLAELGFGTAMNYNLYSAIHEKDENRIKSLMKYYKKIYISIGFIIMIIGACITPFINNLISSNVVIDCNIYIIFNLYVLNTASTYFFSYRTAFINANQLRRIVDFWTILFNIFREITAVFVLYFTKNFYLYLVTLILFNVFLYLFLHLKSSKMYPYLNDSDVIPLPKSEKIKIFQNVGALFIYKVASVILSSTDNIIISTMIDTIAVGLLSNYTLISNSIKHLLNKLINAYMASLGLANTCNSTEEKYKLFKIFRIFIFWLYGFVSIGIFLLINNVVEVWLGDEYLLEINVIFAISLYFWLEGCGNLTYSFRTTLGLFKESKYTPVIGSLLNLGLSILLCIKFGVFGVLIATPISRMLTYFWIDPSIIYKKRFNKKSYEYFIYFFFYTIATIISLIISYFSIKYVNVEGILGIIVKIVLVTIVSNFIYAIFFVPQKEFWIIIRKIIKLFRKK